MFAGPVFTRELVTAPRRVRLYVARSAYVLALLVLMSTAWQVLLGTQIVRNIGDMARFGAAVFQILAPLQLAIVTFVAALSAASAVAAEKDKKTIVLLLLTRLSNGELVLGKLLASMLNIFVLILAALPLFMLIALFGGVGFDQIARAFSVTLASALVAGSLGSTLALWREKTFQTLALTALVLVFWLAGWEAVARGALGAEWLDVSSRTWAAGFSPWQAILEATRPYAMPDPALGWLGTSVHLFLLVAVGLSIVLNGAAIALVRVWNPSREARPDSQQLQERESILGASHSQSESPAVTIAVHGAPGKTRDVWDNPIIWREIRTWAYGRKILVIRLVYLLLCALAIAGMHWTVSRGEIDRGDLALPLVPLMVLSLVLINAQAVTSMTSERDARALDLLLVTDLTPKEIIFGKLGGVLYNTKEMVLVPMLGCGYLWQAGALGFENLVYLLGAWIVMVAFVSTLGIHAGMTYANSKSAIAVSLGTVFFLFVGVAVCMRIMVAFSGSFQVQLQPFLAFMLGGGAGLYAALGWRNPSPAIQVASIIGPFAIFYCITSFLLGYTLAVFLVMVFTFGFTVAAMLVPALFEFDIATGRTTGGED